MAQWKQQFLHFSNISERQICTFTQGEKEVVRMIRYKQCHLIVGD